MECLALLQSITHGHEIRLHNCSRNNLLVMKLIFTLQNWFRMTYVPITSFCGLFCCFKMSWNNRRQEASQDKKQRTENNKLKNETKSATILWLFFVAIFSYTIQGSGNGGFQTVVRVFWGNEIPLPPFYLNLTSFLPQFYLFLASFLPSLSLDLTSAPPRISSHGLETTVYRLLDNWGFGGILNMFGPAKWGHSQLCNNFGRNGTLCCWVFANVWLTNVIQAAPGEVPIVHHWWRSQTSPPSTAIAFRSRSQISGLPMFGVCPLCAVKTCEQRHF